MDKGGLAQVRASAISLRALTAAVLGLLTLFVLLGIWASHTRGIWLDEAWSILEGRRDLSFRDAFLQRWRFEISPPYFYMTSWLFQPLTGDGIFGRRLLNLVPLAAAAFAFWAMGRRDPLRVPFLALFALLLLSNSLTAAYFPEHRAYLTIIAGSAVIAAAIASMFATGSDYRRPDRLLVGLMFGGMLTVFSLHYIVAFEVGLIVAAMIAVQWLRGMRRWAIAMAGAATLASLPIVAAYAVQSAILRNFADHGWIDTSAFTALMLMAIILMTLFLPIAVAMIASLPSLRNKSGDFPAARVYFAASGAAFVLSFAALMAANQVQPLVVSRYLSAYIPFIIAPLAAIAAPTFATNRFLFVGVTAFAVVFTGISAVSVAREGRWNYTASLIMEVRATCADAPVIAVPYWHFYNNYQLGPNEPEAWRIGLNQVAQRFAIPFREAGAGHVLTRCPTILWVEHFYPTPPSPEQVIEAADLAVPAGLARRSITRRGATGFVTIIPAR